MNQFFEKNEEYIKLLRSLDLKKVDIEPDFIIKNLLDFRNFEDFIQEYEKISNLYKLDNINDQRLKTKFLIYQMFLIIVVISESKFEYSDLLQKYLTKEIVFHEFKTELFRLFNSDITLGLSYSATELATFVAEYDQEYPLVIVGLVDFYLIVVEQILLSVTQISEIQKLSYSGEEIISQVALDKFIVIENNFLSDFEILFYRIKIYDLKNKS